MELSNVNSSLQKLQQINFGKFSYIEFFNSEEAGFKVEIKQVYRNILKSAVRVEEDNEDGNCLSVCL